VRPAERGRGTGCHRGSVLARIELIPCTAAIRERAGASFPVPPRALEAIHAASALFVREEIALAMVYDADLRAALATEGLPVTAPAARV